MPSRLKLKLLFDNNIRYKLKLKLILTPGWGTLVFGIDLDNVTSYSYSKLTSTSTKLRNPTQVASGNNDNGVRFRRKLKK